MSDETIQLNGCSKLVQDNVIFIHSFLFFQSTALDKASRFFQGRKHIPLQEFGDQNDEVF